MVLLMEVKKDMDKHEQYSTYLYWKNNKEEIRQRIISTFNLDKDFSIPFNLFLELSIKIKFDPSS